MNNGNPDAAYFDNYERSQFCAADTWFETALSYEGEEPARKLAPPPKDEKLIILCMTPRSGSTALASVLDKTKQLGRGGERLNRKEGASLDQIARRYQSRTKVDLLSAAINHSASKNGVRLIKCALPQIYPFLKDAACIERLANAKFALLTRRDMLGQAISLYRGHKSGVWHSPQAGAGKIRPIEYDYSMIHKQLWLLGNMIGSFGRVFAALGISPVPITYEQVVSDTNTVVQRLAGLAGVELEQEIDLSTSGHTKMANSESEEFRRRFLADYHANLTAQEG